MLLAASDESPIHAVDHTFSTILVMGGGPDAGSGTGGPLGAKTPPSRWAAVWPPPPPPPPSAVAYASRVASCGVAGAPQQSCDCRQQAENVQQAENAHRGYFREACCSLSSGSCTSSGRNDSSPRHLTRVRQI